MDWIAGYLDNFTTFLQWIWDFLAHGIYDFIKEGMVILTKAAMYSWFQIQLFALDIAFETAQSLMSDLGVVDAVRSRWSGLPAEVANTLAFFGVPQALNIIFSALSTRFVLKFVPFFGR